MDTVDQILKTKTEYRVLFFLFFLLSLQAKLKVVPLEGGHGVCTRRLKAGCDIGNY